jgi:drug/metabolite transporter (DMT)-like permease
MLNSPAKVASNLVPLLGEGRRRGPRPLFAVAAPYVGAAALFCGHVALGACERASFRMMAVSMSPFYVVLHQLVAAAHLLLFAPIACLQAQLDSSSSQLRRCPKHALLTMAILDTMQCLLALYAGGRVLGVTQAVLVQGTIPCTMLLATLVLRTRFERVQVVGAGIVLLSVVGACVAPAGGAPGEEYAVDRALFALSSVFAATGAVYKRRRLMLQVIDCTYLNAWLAFFQFACGLVLAPALFGFDALRGVEYGSREIGPSADDDQVFAHSEVLRNIDEGVRCLFWASVRARARERARGAARARARDPRPRRASLDPRPARHALA